MKVVCSLLCFLLFLSCAGPRKSTAATAFAANPVIAHRGAFKKNNFPENSIAALREAIRLGCTGSEFDVRMSADDSLLINHDPHYQKKEIEKTTYADLASVPLSNGEVLPTLRKYLQAGLSRNTATRLVVEIKPSGIGKERGKRIAEKVVALVRELKADKMVVYISFDYDILKKIIEMEPAALTQYLNGDQPPQQLKADRITGADYNLSVFRKNAAWVKEAKEAGIVLNAWTVNEEADMKQLLSEGFDFITTNEPERLFSLLKTGNKSAQ